MQVMDQLLKPSNIVGPTQTVVNSVTTPSRNQWPDASKVDSQVKEIFTKLDSLQSYVDDAERRSMMEKESMQWLEKFKNMADMVEDWWDQFRIISLRPKNLHDLYLDEEADQKSIRTATPLEKVRSLISSVCFRLKQDLASTGIALKTKLLNDELSRILEDANKSNYFRSKSLMSVPILDHATTTNLYGIENDSSELRGLLFNRKATENNTVAVISIIGEGGTGKTTLARLVYNDSEVKEFFELRKWVCMSETSEEEAIANALLSWSPGKGKDSAMSPESLFQMIKDSFSRKKFFLVLDDVCTENSSIWEPFRDSLKDGAPGSAIVVTARSEKVANAIGTDHLFNPRPRLLSANDSWELLKGVSLPGKSSQFCKDVEVIGRKIAAKCKGVPLNLKIIGCHLQFKDTIPEWGRFLQSDLWELSEQDSYDFGPIHISYDNLPPQLKRCFLYLALFPIDAVINVERLIWLWSAAGFLGPPSQNGDKRMEEKGMEYFNILARRSFFHDWEFVKGSLHKNKIISCKMHNNVHKFAQLIARGKFPAGKTKGSASAVLDIQKMRSFLTGPHSEIPKDLFRRLKLRALDLSSCQLEELPPEVGDLILLKYLNLSGNPLKKLPETICDLQFLEFLDVHLCYILSHLPLRIGALQQLRHLRMNYTTEELQKVPPEFEKLTSVRTLDVFRAGGRYNDIGILKNLDDLEEICITIHSKVEFKDAELDKKAKMKNLEFCFVGDGRDVEIVRCFNALRPPPNLQMLKLEGYPSLQLPKWLEAESLAMNLKRLTLRSVLNLLSLSALRKLSSLEFLWLYDIRNLKHLGREFFGLPKFLMNKKFFKDIKEYDEGIVAFPSLKALRIECMEDWRTWEDLNEYDEWHISKISLMPHLEELIIESCPKLETPPLRILQKISSLKVSKVNGQELVLKEPIRIDGI